MSKAKTGGGDSGSYDYFGTIAGAICAGPVTELLAVIVDGAEVWPRAKAWESGQSISINNLRAHSGKTWKALTNHTTSSGNAPPDPTNWTQYSLVKGVSDDYADLTIEGYGDLRIYWGTSTQTVDTLLLAANNDAGETHPDYKDICYIVLKDFLLGRERESAPNVEVVVRRKPVQTVVTGSPSNLSDGQANIMACIAEVFTSQNGLGQASALLDATSFNSAATSLHTKIAMCGVSPLLDGQVTFSQFLRDMALIGDLFLRYNPATGLIEAGIFSHGTAPGAYTDLTADDLAEVPVLQSQGWPSVATRAVVQFNDRERGFKQTSLKVDDLRAHRVLGEHRPITLQRPSITRASQALAHGAESLRTLGRPQLSGQSIYVRREKGRNIRPGGYVRLDIDIEPGGAQLLQFFRVMERSFPAYDAIQLTLDADETQAPMPYTPGDTPQPELPQTVPAISNQRLIEAPILLADVVDSVLVFAERPNKLITGVKVFFDTITGGTFQQIGAGTGFACRATLRTALTSSATTVEITAPAQSDLDRLELQPGTLGANDDTLLAVLVKVADGYTGGVGLATTTTLKGSGTGATVTPTISAGKITAASVVSGGSGYAVGDKITPTDSTGTGAILTVATLSGSAIATLTVSNGGSIGTVDEDADGYAHIEVCSISAQALVSGSNYDLTVLRARRGTKARAFATADSEVWIIPRASLVSFFHADFATIRQNRINLGTPDFGFFRLAPYTYVADRELADCTSIAFRWATKSQSAPNLTLTTPALSPYAVTNPYPVSVTFAGTWSDGDSDLTSWQILTRKGADANVLVKEEVFTSTASKAFSEPVQISGPGTWFVTLRAYDALGLKFERIIQIDAGGATAKCAKPEFYWGGNKLTGGGALSRGTLGIINLKCQTPGSTIEYRYRAKPEGFGYSTFSSWTTATQFQISSHTPLPSGPGGLPSIEIEIEARADAATHTQSDTESILVQV